MAQPQRAVVVPLQAVELPVAVGDSFWVNQGLARAGEPPPHAVRSLSLGYVGNEPLPGGVMRDTPMEQPGAIGPGQSWQRYVRSGGWPAASPHPFHVPDYAVAGPGYVPYGVPYSGPYNYPQPGWPTCPGCAP